MRRQINLQKALWLGAALWLLAAACGCNDLPVPSKTSTPTTSPQTYMAPIVAGLTGTPLTLGPVTVSAEGTSYIATYTIDDAPDCSVANGVACFTQSTTLFQGVQEGTLVNDSGVLTVLARGLRDLGSTYAFPYGDPNGAGISYVSPQDGSYAVELAGQAGGLVQLLGQAVTPLGAAGSCPSIAKAETFQFLTIPAALTSSAGTAALTWDPAAETAYGSVSVTTSGDTVAFGNIQQFTLPGVGATPPAFAATASGICSQTAYGYTVAVPDTLRITTPGNGQTVTPAATIAIGPSGLLVESNGNNTVNDYVPGVEYNNVLGAGSGAVGLPQPASALGTTPAGSTQYLGFLYGTGNSLNGSQTGWTSNLVSFGFPSALQTSCAAFAAQTGPLTNGIYGGDFPVQTATNLPTTGLPDPNQAAVQANGGFGNCDLAIDLGTESSTSSGLYPAATIWIGSTYFANTTSPPVTYSLPAVAIAGPLNGKLAIFVLGQETTTTSSPQPQAWSFYLMQSN